RLLGADLRFPVPGLRQAALEEGDGQRPSRSQRQIGLPVLRHGRHLSQNEILTACQRWQRSRSPCSRCRTRSQVRRRWSLDFYESSMTSSTSQRRERTSTSSPTRGDLVETI